MGNYDTRAGDKARDALAGLFGFASEDDRNFLNVILGLGAGAPFIHRTNFDALATTAGSAAAEAPLGGLFNMQLYGGATARQFRLIAAKIFTMAALTASDTNYADIRLYSYTSAGASKTTVASVPTKTTGSSGTGNWTAYTQVDVPIIGSQASLPAAGGLTYEILKPGTGVALHGNGTLSVYGIPL